MTKVNELVIGGLNDAVARIAVAAAEASGLGTAELPVNVALLLRDQGAHHVIMSTLKLAPRQPLDMRRWEDWRTCAGVVLYVARAGETACDLV